jgi:U6 snRNA-associated Sm-like protein LSm4
MNINLKEVICTSPDGTAFWRLPEVHLRGNSIKYLRIPDDILDIVKEDRQYKKSGGKNNRKKK